MYLSEEQIKLISGRQKIIGNLLKWIRDIFVHLTSDVDGSLSANASEWNLGLSENCLDMLAEGRSYIVSLNWYGENYKASFFNISVLGEVGKEHLKNIRSRL